MTLGGKIEPFLSLQSKAMLYDELDRYSSYSDDSPKLIREAGEMEMML